MDPLLKKQLIEINGQERSAAQYKTAQQIVMDKGSCSNISDCGLCPLFAFTAARTPKYCAKNILGTDDFIDILLDYMDSFTEEDICEMYL